MRNLYGKYLSIHVKSAFEYRASLVFNMIAGSLTTIASFFAIFFLFQSFDNIGGYGLKHVLITYSMIHFTFSTSECMFRGFDLFDRLVRSGDLDRLLIRPRSIFFQVLGNKIELNKLGRILFSGAILIYALATSSISWTIMKVLVVLFMIIGSIILFASLFLIYSSVSIFTVNGLEVMNTLTDGGRDLAEYPIDVYSTFFRKFFTYVVPFGVVNYLPLRFLLGFETSLLYAFIPLSTVLFFVICFFLFNWAITKYKSTGS